MLENLNTYAGHYIACKKKYDFETPKDAYSVRLEKNAISFDLSLIESIRVDVERVLNSNQIIENEFAIYIKNFDNISKLEDLCRKIVPYLESKVFGSYVKIERIHILKNLLNAPSESSWLWHYDNCPKEFLKFAIYLNNVNESSGPMEYIRKKEIIPIIETYRVSPRLQQSPVYVGSRIPSQKIENLFSEGAYSEAIVGPQGTNFIFSPNIIHRGTAPTGNDQRMAIFFFVRPSLKKINNHVSSALSKKDQSDVKTYKLD